MPLTAKQAKKRTAVKHSPGYAVERYVAPSGMQKNMDTKKKSKALKTLDAPKIDKAAQKRVDDYGKLAKTVREVGTTFGIRKTAIMEAVEAGNIDHAILQFQRQAYATIVNLIPIAEAEYIRDKREHQAYVLNAMISQGRELAADLAASGDSAQLAGLLIQEVIEPMFKALLQQFMQEQMQLKTLLADKFKPDMTADASREMDASIKRIASVMTDLYKSTAVQVNKKILGE